MDKESSKDRLAIGPGKFVAVVGPSGAGKDTVLRGAQTLFAEDPRIIFPQRLVTRRPSPDEHNSYISARDYADLLKWGDFALAWSAHGLSYAVPASIDDDIRRGAMVIVNISRTAVDAARQRYEACHCIYIDASPAARMARIGSRGRESAEELVRRMDRTVGGGTHEVADLLIMNDGTPEQAAIRFADYCQSLLHASASA